MSDVFLSYSRRDQEVVRRLHAALAEAGREAWVDWQGIPPTAEWMAEVRAAVDAADAFVVVLSPDWAASPVCRAEAEHAVSRGKRIVPVVVRDTDPAQVPERVSAHNWIFLREGDDFGAGVATLMAALDLDLEWVHAHTRLLTRAGEWDARGRERSLLLRGRDLQAAEALLADAAAHRDPQPTPLQAEYLYASRQAERRSGRIRSLLLAGGLLVALVLAGAAVWQLFRAEEQTRLAESATHLAQARELAAGADGQLTHDPELSVLLARKAVTLWQDQGIDQTLRQALQASRIRGRFVGHEGEVRSVVYSADGLRLVTSSLDGTVRIWDTGTRALLHTLQPAHGTPAAAVMQRGWDPGGRWDHRRLAGGLGHRDRRAGPRLRCEPRPGDRSRLQPRWPQARHGGRRQRCTAVGHLHLAADLECATGAGRAAVQRGVRGRWPNLRHRWRGSHRAGVGRLQGALISKAVGHTGFVYGIALSPDGRRIATASQDETARVWDAATGLQLAVLRGNDDGVNAVAFGLDGTTIATAGLDGTVRTWDAATGRQLSSLAGHDGGCLRPRIRPSRRLPDDGWS